MLPDRLGADVGIVVAGHRIARREVEEKERDREHDEEENERLDEALREKSGSWRTNLPGGSARAISRRFASARAAISASSPLRETERLPFDLERSPRTRPRCAARSVVAVDRRRRARPTTLVMRSSRESARAAEVSHDALAPAPHEDRTVLEERGGGLPLRAPRDLPSPDGELVARHRGEARSARLPFGLEQLAPARNLGVDPERTERRRDRARISCRYVSPRPAPNSAEPAGAATQYVSSPSWRSARPR